MGKRGTPRAVWDAAGCLPKGRGIEDAGMEFARASGSLGLRRVLVHRYQHLVTLNSDGSPQVTCVWVGLDDDEIVSGCLATDQRKLKNVVRDPRVALSIAGTEIHPPGLKEYLVVHGRARLVEGGAAELLQRLA
jgi:PPOX class probable F420-dependent enzyme